MKSKKNIYADVFVKNIYFVEKDHLFSKHRHLFKIIFLELSVIFLDLIQR